MFSSLIRRVPVKSAARSYTLTTPALLRINKPSISTSLSLLQKSSFPFLRQLSSCSATDNSGSSCGVSCSGSGAPSSGGSPHGYAYSAQVAAAVRERDAANHSYAASLLTPLPPHHTLPGPSYTDERVFEAELKQIWYKEWVFIGHTFEIAKPGDHMQTQIGKLPIVITRDKAGNIHAFHNVCRHRGFKLVEQAAASVTTPIPTSVNSPTDDPTPIIPLVPLASDCHPVVGHVARRFVCPYHQWTYELDGKLAFARDAPAKDPAFVAANSLVPVHIECVGSYMWVCVADTPPDFSAFRDKFKQYTEPFGFEKAAEEGGVKVAYSSTIVEKANWKLVWENNRECFHCTGSHPELGVTFPSDPSWNGVNLTPAKQAEKDAFDRKAAELGLPSEYVIEPTRSEWRMMRMAFVKNRASMTMTGEPAVLNGHRLGRMPVSGDAVVGDVLCFHYPNTWNHWQADYALSFSMLPISATQTQLTTRWIVPASAEEGKDYDLKTLTEVWIRTNDQDRVLVERQQKGVTSRAYRPAAYNMVHEDGVAQFIDWYRKTMTSNFN